jgi:RNA polymerase sigma factor (sigma-70 family)
MEVSATEPLRRLSQSREHDEMLLAEVGPLVVRTVRLVVGSGSAVAEDAAQEALLELMRSLPQLREAGAASAFAARIATRVALRVARRERRLRLLGLHVRDDRAVTSNEQPFELIELKEAFDRLPPRQRAVAVLRLYVGLSERETAEALGCSIGTVKHQLHDARRTLTGYLSREPGTRRRRRAR